MNLHIKTGSGIKNYVLDPNSDVENENLWLIFGDKFEQKTQKSIFSSESVKTKENKESNSCEKYHFSINAFYKINLWPISKKLLQKLNFRHFPLFEIFAQMYLSKNMCSILSYSWLSDENLCLKLIVINKSITTWLYPDE